MKCVQKQEEKGKNISGLTPMETKLLEDVCVCLWCPLYLIMHWPVSSHPWVISLPALWKEVGRYKKESVWTLEQLALSALPARSGSQCGPSAAPARGPEARVCRNQGSSQVPVLTELLVCSSANIELVKKWIKSGGCHINRKHRYRAKIWFTLCPVYSVRAYCFLTPVLLFSAWLIYLVWRNPY